MPAYVSCIQLSLTCWVSNAGGDSTVGPWANNGISPDSETVLNKFLQSRNH